MGLPSSLLLEDLLSSYIFFMRPHHLQAIVDWIFSKLVSGVFEFLCFITSVFSNLLAYVHRTKGWFYNYILTWAWILLTLQISFGLCTAPIQRKCCGFKELTWLVPCTWISLSSHSLGCNSRGNVSWKSPSNSVNHSHCCDTINQICLYYVTLLTTTHLWFSAKDA